MSSYNNYSPPPPNYSPSAPPNPQSSSSSFSNYPSAPPPSTNYPSAPSSNYPSAPPPSSNYPSAHPSNYPSAPPPSSNYPSAPSPSSNYPSAFPPPSSYGFAPPSSSNYPYAPPPSSNYPSAPPPSTNYSSSPSASFNYSSAAPPPRPYGYSSSFSGGQTGYFPPGTPPDIVSSFQNVDRDRSGFIDEYELQSALSSGYQKFSLKTIRLLMFLFGNPKDSSKIGPTEFAALWNCLGQWREIFERFDRDRSGEIDSAELKDALLSLGYAVPQSVVQVLITKYTDAKGGRGSLDFDSFVECGTIVRGLTDKFKEKDQRYTGSATLTYDDFMLMVIPFLVS